MSGVPKMKKRPARRLPRRTFFCFFHHAGHKTGETEEKSTKTMRMQRNGKPKPPQSLAAQKGATAMAETALEAVREIMAWEERARKQVQDAEAEAGRIVSDAERAGREQVARARVEAERQAALAVQAAEERGARRAEALLQERAEECRALCRAAEGRLDAAAEYIAGRIVDMPWPL